MALLERVTTLIRANLNELIEKAENPEVMLKQVITDMENHFIQVKTQVAVAIADQHLLEKRQKENEEKSAEWRRKAEFAVDRQQDDLARAALARSETHRLMAERFQQQVADQTAQVENLKSALQKLEQKLAEARGKRDILIAQHRRSRALGKASDARISIGDRSKTAAFDRLKDRVQEAEAVSQARPRSPATTWKIDWRPWSAITRPSACSKSSRPSAGRRADHAQRSRRAPGDRRDDSAPAGGRPGGAGEAVRVVRQAAGVIRFAGEPRDGGPE